MRFDFSAKLSGRKSMNGSEYVATIEGTCSSDDATILEVLACLPEEIESKHTMEIVDQISVTIRRN